MDLNFFTLKLSHKTKQSLLSTPVFPGNFVRGVTSMDTGTLLCGWDDNIRLSLRCGLAALLRLGWAAAVGVGRATLELESDRPGEAWRSTQTGGQLGFGVG